MDIQHIFESHLHWQDIVTVTKKLSQAGHTVYLAGGCVRDALLGIAPHDFDVASSATPDEVKTLFPNALDVGRQFGVMVVPIRGHQIEIATFRLDGDYLDGRHPQNIQFSRPKEDALRRDFTVNALFYDLQSHKVVDFIHGQEDLKKQILRAVGDADRRFNEDKLRMLRAARFAAQLGFTIEENTYQAILKMADQIHVVSRERITDEIRKLAVSKHPDKGLEILKSSGLFEQIWPGFQFHLSPLWRAFLRASVWLAPIRSFELFIATLTLFEILQTGTAPKIHFVLSRESERRIQFLIQGFFQVQQERIQIGGSWRSTGIEDQLLLLNDEDGPLLSELCYNMSLLGFLPKEKISDLIDRFLELSDLHGFLPKALLTGQDLIELGVPQTKKMGDLLKEAYRAQLRGEFKNKKSAQDWVLGRLGAS